MKYSLLALVILLTPLTVLATPFQQSQELMIWNETLENGKNLDSEVIARLAFNRTHQKELGKLSLNYNEKYYFGGGPYIGTDFNTGSKRTYSLSGNFGTQQEGQVKYNLNQKVSAVGGVGIETWLRYQSGYEIYAVPYARLGGEYKGDKVTLAAGIRKPLKAYEMAYNAAIDYTVHLNPQTDKYTPYLNVGYKLNQKQSVQVYYEGYNFGQSQDAQGGIYQPHSTMNLIGVQFTQTF